jgi:ElaB/YqjD/DUF883 family membrane-anchored ribosome-binding protein
MARTTSSKVGEVKDQAKDVADEVAALAVMLRDVAAGAGEDLRDAGAEKLAEIARRSQALVDRVKSTTQSEIASLEQSIAERPLQSALIALVIGVVLGALLRR